MRKTSAIGGYILELCERQHLSMRDASLRAGLGSETIGMIVRRGDTTTPRPDTLRLIADALGGDYTHMLRLAGHLEADQDIPLAGIPRLRAFVDRLEDLPFEAQERIMDTALMLLEINDAAQASHVLPEPQPIDAPNDAGPGAEDRGGGEP